MKNHMQNKEKLFPDSFLKNLNWAYIWINSIKFIQFVFVDCQVDDYRSILKLSCWPLVFVSNQAPFFLKKEKEVPLSYFLHDIWRKNIYLVIFYYLTKFHCSVVFITWDIGQYMYCNFLLTSACDVLNFEINLIFLMG